jgi:polysaccharide chain length determinant protein (PEP-CTERM system associated)
MDSKNMMTVNDVIEIIRRRRWIILVPIFFAVPIGMYIAIKTPKIYEANTLVIVQAQSVPEDYVRSVVTDDAESKLSTISQQITSRANLEKIINDFGLMPKGESNVFLEDVINVLQNNIRVKVRRDRKGSDTFSISFKGGNPTQVMEITNALTDYFILNSLAEREGQATGTNQFLEDELQNVRKRLLSMEAELKEYRRQFMGELPEQLNSNLARMQGLQSQLATKEASLRDLKLRLSEIDSQSISTEGGAIDPFDIEAMERQLGELTLRYTENHPDVVRLKSRLSEMRALQNQGGAYRAGSTSRVERKRSEFTREMAGLENQIAELTSQLAIYQRRVEETPKREQELISLRRDYDNMSNLYSSLLKRKLESEISVSMEKKQKGEQFQVIDRARVPVRPIEPDVERIFFMTLAVGFGLGFGLAYLLEYTDSTYRKPENIEHDYKLPILAAIPIAYRSSADIKRGKLEIAMCSIFAILTLALIGMFSFVTWIGLDEAVKHYRNYLNL